MIIIEKIMKICSLEKNKITLTLYWSLKIDAFYPILSTIIGGCPKKYCIFHGINFSKFLKN
jgi:hypothetical protein